MALSSRQRSSTSQTRGIRRDGEITFVAVLQSRFSQMPGQQRVKQRGRLDLSPSGLQCFHLEPLEAHHVGDRRLVGHHYAHLIEQIWSSSLRVTERIGATGIKPKGGCLVNVTDEACLIGRKLHSHQPIGKWRAEVRQYEAHQGEGQDRDCESGCRRQQERCEPRVSERRHRHGDP